MTSKNFILLLFIILFAAFLRFHQLGQNPPSLTWDEAAWGYNAYALGIDGRDEFGRFLPVDYIESFGDFKPPVYAYLTVLPVKIFGLSEFAVRFPSALFGVLTVLVTYFLVKRIYPTNPKSDPSASLRARIRNPKQIQNSNDQIFNSVLEIGSASWRRNIPIIVATMLAISPWHINLSRAAFEANVATFFLVCGVCLFLGGVAERRWYLPLSIGAFILSMYTFNTARVVAPLLILMLAIGFRRELLERKRQVALAMLLGLLLIIPLAQFLLAPQARLRFQEVNIFSDIRVIERTNQEIANDNNVWWSRILHNRRFAYTAEYLRHYFDHFKPHFLFIQGDGNPKFSTQDVGLLYLWELPFFITGILFLFRRKFGYWWIVPLWLLIGIIPSATARETPHALRIEATLPTWQILVSYGLVVIMQRISNIKRQVANIQIRYVIFSFCFSILIFNFLYYIHGYYAHYPREYSGEWQYGYKSAIAYIQDVADQYDKIVFTEALGRPYIYTLFYTKEDPQSFRETAKISREVFGFVHVESFSKYIFTKEPKSLSPSDEKVLYIDVPKELPKEAQILRTFYLLNGKPALIAYTR